MSLDGILVIDKSSGPTSHDVVASVRRQFRLKSVGHAGTLDPMASGVLVLLIGEATKISSFPMGEDKRYRLTAQLGIITDTWDVTGVVQSKKPIEFTEEKIREAALSLQGEFLWPIPLFSAKKIDGEKLYEKARRGEELAQLPEKSMTFRDLEIHAVGADWIELSITCAKGGFIRTWAYQLGQLLGCGGTLKELRRVASYPYLVNQAVRLEDLKQVELSELPKQAAFIPFDSCFPAHWRAVRVPQVTEMQLRNGLISHDLRRQLIHLVPGDQSELIKIQSQEDGRVLAVIEFVQNTGFTLRRVFVRPIQ
jgi:tRNA pseudouridine55 synthase